MRSKSKSKRKFSREFKLEALKLVEERGLNAACDSLGVTSGMVCNWRRKLKEEGVEALGAPGGTPSLEDEVKELRRRVQELEEEKEILKKAAAYFAKHSK